MRDIGEELKKFLETLEEKNVDLNNFSEIFNKADGIRLQADTVAKQEIQKAEQLRHQIEEEEKVIADTIPKFKIKDDVLYDKMKMLEEMLNSLANRLEINVYLREIFWRLSYRLVKLLEVSKGMSMATELLNAIQKERKEMYDEQWNKFMEYQEMVRKYNSAFEKELRDQIKLRDELLKKLSTALAISKESLVERIEKDLKLTEVQADKIRKAVDEEIRSTVGKKIVEKPLLNPTNNVSSYDEEHHDDENNSGSSIADIVSDTLEDEENEEDEDE